MASATLETGTAEGAVEQAVAPPVGERAGVGGPDQLPTWRCGHPRTPENTSGTCAAKPGGQCRTCAREKWAQHTERRRTDPRARLLQRIHENQYRIRQRQQEDHR